MEKRKEGRERSENLMLNRKEEEDREEEEANGGGGGGGGFFACYLLCSLCPRYKGHTYIGFTVNPCRRIKQHNGELRSGAWRTKSKRPWEMILCIYGFPTNVTALQFEWAWQNPTVSLAVRKAAVNLKSLSGIVGKIKLAYEMLTLPPWDSLKLTVNFFSTKYMKNAAGCKSLPKQMKVHICPMDELPCYTGLGQISDEMDDDCNEDEDAESGTNKSHLEGPTDRSASGISDYHHDSLERVHEVLKQNENDAIRQLGEPLTLVEENQTKAASEEKHRQLGEALTLVEENQTKAASEEKHRLPFDVVDSPFITLPTDAYAVETVQDRDPFELTETSSDDFGRQVGTPPAAKEHQPPFAQTFLQSPEFSSRHQGYLSARIEEDHNRLQVETPMKSPPSFNEIEVLSPKQYPEASSGSNDQAASAEKSVPATSKIEVIDISTPSSDCMVNSFRRKKRRNNWVSQEIIDLTKSPNFVQL